MHLDRRLADVAASGRSPRSDLPSAIVRSTSDSRGVGVGRGPGVWAGRGLAGGGRRELLLHEVQDGLAAAQRRAAPRRCRPGGLLVAAPPRPGLQGPDHEAARRRVRGQPHDLDLQRAGPIRRVASTVPRGVFTVPSSTTWGSVAATGGCATATPVLGLAADAGAGGGAGLHRQQLVVRHDRVTGAGELCMQILKCYCSTCQFPASGRASKVLFPPTAPTTRPAGRPAETAARLCRPAAVGCAPADGFTRTR